MKKFIFPITLVAMREVGAEFGHTTATPAEGFSDLQLENIEALANDVEAIDQIPCHSSAKRNYNAMYTKCSTCTDVTGWEGTGTKGTCSVIRR